MRPGLGAVSFSLLPMALRALLHVNPHGNLHRGLRRRERVFEFLEFLGNNPRLVLLPDGVDERHANQGKKQGEEDFTRLKIGLCDRRHCGQKILAQRTSQRKQA